MLVAAAREGLGEGSQRGVGQGLVLNRDHRYPEGMKAAQLGMEQPKSREKVLTFLHVPEGRVVVAIGAQRVALASRA